MRPLIACFLVGCIGTAAAPEVHGQGQPPAGDHRAKTIAALERLMLTGEPLHTSHGDGVWLQAAVDRAFATGDREIQRLAQRAASPLLTHVTAPISSIHDGPSFELRRPLVLTLPRPVTYAAEIFASLDGGELFPVGNAPPAGSSRSLGLPPAARAPGLHHVRLQARIIYKGKGAVPPPETRNLPELTYALFDPARRDPTDARIFIQSPLLTSARRFSEILPEEPLSDWLVGVLWRAATTPPRVDWLGRYCEERVREIGALPRTRHICSVAYFGVRGTIGEIWIRTGRVELTDREVRWITETPTFEAMRLGDSRHAEFDDLADLPAWLDTDPHLRPHADVSVAPEDISVAQVDAGRGKHVEVSAIIRNSGLADARGVEVYLAASLDGARGARESVIVDVPRRGQVEIKRRLPFSFRYGTVLVHAMQLTEHAPFGSAHADPTPEDAVAFRVVNPKEAPSDYAARIRKACMGVCRGY